MRTTLSIATVFLVAQVWSITSGACMYTLEGHDKGVNCLDYYPGGEKPYLVSGADDKTVKVWDYQNKTCVQTLESHTQNVSVVAFHPELPVIISGSEDGASHVSRWWPTASSRVANHPGTFDLSLPVVSGTVRIWHANTYRLENTLNYGMERVWALGVLRGLNDVAIGYDEGTVVIKVPRRHLSTPLCRRLVLKRKSVEPCFYAAAAARPRGACGQHGQQRQDRVGAAQRDSDRQRQRPPGSGYGGRLLPDCVRSSCLR